MNLNVYERVIYSLLDLVGDVGGFNDALGALGSLFIMLFTFQPMNNHLIEKLFSYQGKSTDSMDSFDKIKPPDAASEESLWLNMASKIKLTVL